MATKTKLKLANLLLGECQGISGTTITTTLNQTGEYLAIVRWIDRAYNEIQVASPIWNFLRMDLETETGYNLKADQSVYTASQLGVSHFANWISNENGNEDNMRVYPTDIGYSEEMYLQYLPWEFFKKNYLLGSIRDETGRPQVVSVMPNKSLVFHPKPDKEYTLVCSYYRSPHEFGEEEGIEADDDIPIFPQRFAEMIFYKAQMYYGTKQSEPDVLAEAEVLYKSMMNALQLDQLPPMTWGAPLA